MNEHKGLPKGWKRWLLLAPALEIMVVGTMPERWAKWILHTDDAYAPLTLNLGNLLAAAALSLGLGIWASWEQPSIIERVFVGLAIGFGLIFVNTAIGTAGCVSGHVLLN